jgi:alpha-N-acetylglucosaminidase
MADYSRTLLPEIREAYESKDKTRFAQLTAEWVHCMELQDTLLQTNSDFLLGRWLSYVPQWSSSPAELAKLNYDARSILTTWGDRKASQDGGLHEYGNRDWAGLTHDYYLVRWQLYFAELTKSLDTGKPPETIDWYAFGDRWNRGKQVYSAAPHGDPYVAARAIQLYVTSHQSAEAKH